MMQELGFGVGFLENGGWFDFLGIDAGVGFLD